MKNGGCEDLVAAAPRQPQLVKQGPHLSGLCDLLRGFRLKILVYCFAFHPTIKFGLVSLRPVLTKRGKYILGWNQDFKVVLSKLSSKDYLFGDLLEDVGKVGDEVGVEHLLVGAAVVLADGLNQVHQREHLICRHLQIKHLACGLHECKSLKFIIKYIQCKKRWRVIVNEMIKDEQKDSFPR